MRRVVCFVLIMAVVFGLCACNKSEEVVAEEPMPQGMRESVLYYLDENQFLIPVSITLPVGESMSKETLSYLASPPEESCLIGAIPAETKFEMKIRQGKAVVDISGMGDFEDDQQEKNAISAIVNTVMEFPAVTCVQITVEGKKDKTLKHGTSLAKEFSWQDLNSETVSASSDQSFKNKLTLYFPSKDSKMIVPVTRTIDEAMGIDNAINELIKGPQQQTLQSCFPESTKVNDIIIENGIATIDFSKDFKKVGEMEDVAIETLALTCSQYGIMGIRVTVSGKPLSDEPVFAQQHPNAVE